MYTITTRRVIERSGILGARRRELPTCGGTRSRSGAASCSGCGARARLTLSNGVDQPMRLVNIPSVGLVHEALVDQVEVNQILAHRDAQPLPPPAGRSSGQKG